jgi:CBS domain-containing protein
VTTAIVTVGQDMHVEDVAKPILDKRISGVPVVDVYQNVIRIVSEGDLIRRFEETGGGNPHHSWWLQFITCPEKRAAGYVQVHGDHAKDVMPRNIYRVCEDATLVEIARLLEEHRTKRVPVVTDGRLVGIVSRANMLRGLAPSSSVDVRTIRVQVLDALSKKGWLRHGTLNVIVENGVVQLWDFGESGKECQAMALVTENFDGVSKIEDHLGYVAPYLRTD